MSVDRIEVYGNTLKRWKPIEIMGNKLKEMETYRNKGIQIKITRDRREMIREIVEDKELKKK